MQFTLAAIIALAIVALVGAAPQSRQICPEATRFGILIVSPRNVTAGDTLTITANFDCAINNFGIHPEYTDYYIEVPVNNTGFEPPILLARRGALNGTSDTFNVTVPYSNYVANAGHVVMLETTYPVNGTNGIPYSVVGGIEAPIIIRV